MSFIRNFNSILNSKNKCIDILRLEDYKYCPASRILAPLKQDLAEFASKKDFFSFCEKIQRELLSKALSKENFIASGAQGKVYRIPGTNCAIKIPHDCNTIPNKEIKTNISAQDKINNVIGTIDNRIKILKYIDGSSVKQLTQKGIAVNKAILDMPHESFKAYIEKIVDAAKVNMFHDFGGQNTLINTKYKFIVPIDFYQSLTKRANPIEDIYFQFGNYMKTAEEQDYLLAKSALAYAELIGNNKITPKSIAKTDIGFTRINDCFKPKNETFFYEVESRLKKISGLKKIEFISPDIEKSLQEEIRKFNEFVVKNITKG